MFYGSWSMSLPMISPVIPELWKVDYNSVWINTYFVFFEIYKIYSKNVYSLWIVVNSHGLNLKRKDINWAMKNVYV